MTRALDELLRDPRIWRGRLPVSLNGQRTGFAALDEKLPGRGWPAGSLIELLPTQAGIGELSLLLPALRHQFQSWVAPPYIPYAPALAAAGIDLEKLLVVQAKTPKDSLWALEQILRAGLSSHVLAWHAGEDSRVLRRLQLAAESGGARLFLFRPPRFSRQPSPAALRLYLAPAEQGLYLRLLKCRGAQPTSLILPLASPSTPHALALHPSSPATARRAADRAA